MLGLGSLSGEEETPERPWAEVDHTGTLLVCFQPTGP